MAAPNPKRQRLARQTLKELFDKPDNVWVIHYSCESFYDREDSNSPRVTSIAVRNLHSAQTRSFSIHHTAEVNGIGLKNIEECYDELEREMLEEFFSYISGFQTIMYIHWNMRDANYGFQAIEHRFRALGGKNELLYVVDDRNKVDLARLVHDIYGSDYIGHPRLQMLVTKGGTIKPPPGFLTGKEEAKAFEDRDFVSLHQSTLRKVDVIANIAALAQDRRLETNTSWWEMRGGNVVTFANWLGVNPIFALIVGSVTIFVPLIGIIFGLLAILKVI